MKKYNLQFYFILFFLLDKLILLPIFKFNITETLPGTPYLETLENKEPERFHTDDYKNHKKVWLFGSSRSLWYYVLPVPKNTLADPFLDRHAKEKLNQYHFVPFASPGSNTSIYYVRLNQLLERGYKPDLIALELSIYAFNHNNRFVHSSKIEGFPLMFTLKHSNEMPFEFSRDIITSRIFATTRYKITVTGIKHNLFGIRPPGQNAMLEQLFSGSADPFQAFFDRMTGSERVDKIYADKEFMDFREDAVFTDLKEYMFRIKLPLPILKKEFFTNYEYDSNMFYFLELILQKAHQEKIPVVIWIQKEHPEMKKIISENNMEQKWLEKISKISRNYNASIVNFNGDKALQCNYYGDVFHASGRCITEMSWKMIETLEK